MNFDFDLSFSPRWWIALALVLAVGVPVALVPELVTRVPELVTRCCRYIKRRIDPVGPEDIFRDPKAVALAEAARRGDLAAMERLLKEGVDVNVRGKFGITPLFWAMAGNQPESFRFLLEHGADPNVRLHEIRELLIAEDSTLMHVLARWDDIRFLKLALAHGGDPNAVNKERMTPLFEAIEADSGGPAGEEGMEHVRLLVEAGADINFPGWQDLEFTPPMYAAMLNQYDVVWYLLQKGADYRYRTKRGHSLGTEVVDSKVSRASDMYPYYQRVVNFLESHGISLEEERARLKRMGREWSQRNYRICESPFGRYGFTAGPPELPGVPLGKCVRVLKGHDDLVHSVAFSSDGRYLATGSWDSTARIWETETGRLVRTFESPTSWVFSVRFSPDGRYLLTATFDSQVQLWEVATGRMVRTYQGAGRVVYSAVFSPDGRLVLAGCSEDGRMWERSTGRLVRRLQVATAAGLIEPVEFTPDGRHALGGWRDGGVRVWDRSSGRLVRTFVGPDTVTHSVAVSADGRLVAAGYRNHTALVWDFVTGKALWVIREHPAVVSSVAFSPDGRYLLTGSWDGTARLWDVRRRRAVRVFRGDAGAVLSVAFSPDGRYVATGCQDGTARLWLCGLGQQEERTKAQGE